MATFSCTDCKNKVSDKADVCPKCGRKFTPEEIKGFMAKEKKAGGAGCGLLIFIILIAYFFFSGGNEEQSNVVTTSSAPALTQDNIEPIQELVGLGFTPTELTERMNAFTKEQGLPAIISDVQKTDNSPGDVNDAYQADISENIILLMFTRKDEKNINSINLIATPKTNDESTLTLITIGTIIAACNPELDAETRGKALLSLMQDEEGKLNQSKRLEIENTKYTFSASEITGIMLFVENKADKNN